MANKMKDDFELPVKKTPGGVMPFLKDAAGDVIFVGSDKHVRAAVVAINTYDANQERIACLERQISQLEADKLSTAAYAEQRINLLKMINNNTQSVKADAVKDFMEHIQYSEDDGLIDEEYINESYDFWIKMREGKS